MKPLRPLDLPMHLLRLLALCWLLAGNVPAQAAEAVAPVVAPGFVHWTLPTTNTTPYRVYGMALAQANYDARKVWISGKFGIGYRLLCDLEQGQVLGYVTNGNPFCLLGNQLLCVQYYNQAIPKDKTQPASTQNHFWLTDIVSGESKYLGGNGTVFSPATDNFEPSPDGQRGFIVGHRPGEPLAACCLDFAAPGVWLWDPAIMPGGWWDNTHILYFSPNTGVMLYDMVTRQTSALLEATRVAQFFATNQLPVPVSGPQLRTVWNGKETDFFLAGRAASAEAQPPLVQITRPGGLAVRTAPFPLMPNMAADPAGQVYIAPQKISDWFLVSYDAKTGKAAAAAPARDVNTSFGFLRGLLCFHDRDEIYTVNLDGSRCVQIFPPLKGN